MENENGEKWNRRTVAHLGREGFRLTETGSDWGGEYRIYDGPGCITCGVSVRYKLQAGYGELSGDPRGVHGMRAAQSIDPESTQVEASA